ncbi:MAG: family 20 glycosylhydrolase, partial [Candidatus Marinimicrobia bacterium]|nr:family 20 glycosylhydrolase [Candidatus Neomarinimicrobiota bacterium]
MNELNIIPKPVSTVIEDGSIDLAMLKSIALMHNSDDEKMTAVYLQKLLQPINALPITNFEKNKMDQIVLSIEPESPFPAEGYQLIIGEDNGASIKASTKAGLFYGFQTFRQLCPTELEKSIIPKNTQINNCKIIDHPIFGYRGMHLDVSRHFFDINFIKTYIDMIALHKMNVFHWHLTDDNGWRIEINQYPELTEKSAWRVDRRNEPWKEWSPIQPNEKATYGGFYTQDEIRNVIQYAAERSIMVIPEIEMPGHTSEVFAAYPELSCKGEFIPVNPGSYWPNVDIFCAGNDDVFMFLENVLEEVIDLFPGPYIHIGGDEAEKTHWENCPKCQKRIKDEKLRDETELQSWFIKKIEKYILSKNKKLVGWDEILEGGLAKSATVMSWRGMKGGIESAKAGHDVIMCPTSHCYFDYYQANPETSPEAIGGYTTLKKVYSFDPVPLDLSKEDEKFILGAQGNLWTEYVQTPARAQYRVLPRMTALSEVLWSGPGKHSYNNFYRRLSYLEKRFDQLEWSHAPGSFLVSIHTEKVSENKGISVQLTSEKPSETIRFTMDGSGPTIFSSEYTGAFNVDKTTILRAALFINGKLAGQISEKKLLFHKAVGKIIDYKTQYKNKYPGSGSSNLVNGITG